MDRVKALALTLVAAIALVGEQGARFGPFVVPRLSLTWVVLLLVVIFFWSAKSNERRLALRDAVAAMSLGLGFVVLTLWRASALTPPLSLNVTLNGERDVIAQSLQLEARRDLRRLSGRRRDVTLETRALLDVARDGDYRFEIDCDDSCILGVGDARFRDTQSLELVRGELAFSVDYRQLGGPAKLRLAWDTPATIELLPIEYFLRAPGGVSRQSQRWRAHASLALLVLWWGIFSTWVVRVAPLRLQVYEKRWAPVGAAAIIIMYGCLLRVDAFWVHSGRDAHTILQPWVPSYGVFNPANAPDDPYRADVRSYLDRAETFTWTSFYAPSFREPFYIALCMPFLSLADGEVGILLQSLFFSCAALALFGLAAAKLHGPWWAALLLIPVSLHEWLILEAPSGYRMSAYSFFLLATVAAMFLMPTSRRGALVSGALGGMLCLIRLSAVSVVAPLLVLRLWPLSRSERLRYGGIVIGLLVALVGPFLASNALTHGDPFYSISFHTEFWMRAEGIDASRGPVSWARYFTDFGRTGTVLKGTLLGMSALPVRTFWNGLRFFPLLDAAVLVFGVGGLLIGCRSPRRFITAAYLAHLVPFAYIQNFPSGEMPRFVMPSYFFLVLAAPAAAGWLRKLRREEGAAQLATTP
jgi:hypothetical protein